jgi:hypothetical protein
MPPDRVPRRELAQRIRRNHVQGSSSWRIESPDVEVVDGSCEVLNSCGSRRSHRRPDLEDLQGLLLTCGARVTGSSAQTNTHAWSLVNGPGWQQLQQIDAEKKNGCAWCSKVGRACVRVRWAESENSPSARWTPFLFIFPFSLLLFQLQISIPNYIQILREICLQITFHNYGTNFENMIL